MKYEFNQNLSKIENHLKDSKDRVKSKQKFTHLNPSQTQKDVLKLFLTEHQSEPPFDYFHEKRPDKPLYTPKKTNPVTIPEVQRPVY